MDPTPSRLGWLPEPRIRSGSDAGPPRARLLSSQQQPVSGGSGHAAAADGVAIGAAQGTDRSATPAKQAGTAAAEVPARSGTLPSSDASAKPDEANAAQGSRSDSEAAGDNPVAGEGRRPISVGAPREEARPLSESAGKEADSGPPDSLLNKQAGASEPGDSKPDPPLAKAAFERRTAGAGRSGTRAGAAVGPQRPEEADNARAAARQGARQPDPQAASGSKPPNSKKPKNRKAPRNPARAPKGSSPAAKPQDAQPVSPTPDAAQTGDQQAPAQKDAPPKRVPAGAPGGNQTAASEQADQPGTEEHEAPPQQAKPAPAADRPASRYSSHEPGTSRAGTWSSFWALPNMHEAHPHYHECGVTLSNAAPVHRFSSCTMPCCHPVFVTTKSPAVACRTSWSEASTSAHAICGFHACCGI